MADLALLPLGTDFLVRGVTCPSVLVSPFRCSGSVTGSCLSLSFSLGFDFSLTFSVAFAEAILGAKALPRVNCAMPFSASLGLERPELLGVTGLWFSVWASGCMGQI